MSDQTQDNNRFKFVPVTDLEKYRFFIPSFQRGYRWRKEEVDLLLSDIWDEAPESENNNPSFYCLQPLVVTGRLGKDLNPPEIKDEQSNIIWHVVVDGQQRLTTVRIIFEYLNSDCRQEKRPGPFPIKYATRTDSAGYYYKLSHNSLNPDNLDAFHMLQAYNTVAEWFSAKEKSYSDVNVKETFRLKLKNTQFIWYETPDSATTTKTSSSSSSSTSTTTTATAAITTTTTTTTTTTITTTSANPDDSSMIGMYTRLNIGKISLTNSELLRAVILKDDNFKSHNLHPNQYELAVEWDFMEQKLREGLFWGFIHNENVNSPRYETHIEYLFDLMTGKTKDDEYFFTFNKLYNTITNPFNDKLNKTNGPVLDIWNDIRDYFQTFEDWFADKKLYHYVGFLTTETNTHIKTIFENSKNLGVKDKFIQYLKEEIVKAVPFLSKQGSESNSSLLDELSDLKKDSSHHTRLIKKTLLLFNVESVIQSDDRAHFFPFHLYKSKGWDLEHVRSVTSEMPQKDDSLRTWESWATFIIEYFTNISKGAEKDADTYFEKVRRHVINKMPADSAEANSCSANSAAESAEQEDDPLTICSDLLKFLQEKDKKGLINVRNRILKKFNESEDSEPSDYISNLTLLDEHTNRSYKNSVFPIKRRTVMGLDMDGVFVPPCTKNLFLKMYSKNPGNVLFWQDTDATDYLEAMSKVLEKGAYDREHLDEINDSSTSRAIEILPVTARTAPTLLALDTIKSGQRCSFRDLFDLKNFSLVIPLIQRDYAQGRESAREVRNAFVDKLFEYLNSEKPGNDLDFIYGSFNENKFILLDGQQRLTTLFLLHWYLALISNNMKDLRSWLLDAESTPRFYYKVRTSSYDFCKLLLGDLDNNKGMTFAEHILAFQSKTNNKQAISELFMESRFFRTAWKNDPTVMGMLTMLDVIHNKFAGHPEFYNRLVSSDTPFITFYILNLPEHNLTDDIYIKMNGRGIPLTHFETFKASLEQFMKNNTDFSSAEKFRAGKTLPEYVSFRMDGDWLDFFWNKDRALTESHLLNFIVALLVGNITSTLADDTINQKDVDALVGKKTGGVKPSLSFLQLEKVNAVTPDSIHFVANVLDALCDKKNGFPFLSKEYAYVWDEEQLLKTVVTDPDDPDEADETGDKFTYPKRVFFHAYSKFLDSCKREQKTTGEDFNLDGFDEWARIFRNLVLNSDVNRRKTAIPAMKSINNVLGRNQFRTMLAYFAGTPKEKLDDELRGFDEERLREEARKARLIRADQDWAGAIRKAEASPYFTGQISFLLDFCGLSDNNEDDDGNGNGEGVNKLVASKSILENFITYSSKIDALFKEGKWNSSPDKLFVWERSVLSRGDYLHRQPPNKRNFLSSSREDYGNGWKNFLSKPALGGWGPDADDKIDKRMYVKEVLDDWHLSAEAEDKDGKNKLALSALVDGSGREDWMGLFIREPELLKICKRGFIQAPEDGSGPILLFDKERVSGWHMELYSYLFYLTGREKKETFSPFDKEIYCDYAYGDSLPPTYLEGTFENVVCRLSLRLFPRDASEPSFALEMRRQSDDQSPFPPNIAAALLKSGFEEVSNGSDPVYYRNEGPGNSGLKEPGLLKAGPDKPAPEEGAAWQAIRKLCDELSAGDVGKA